jgi:acyl carrier protein
VVIFKTVEEIMTFEKIKKLIANQLGIDEAKITEDARLIEDLGADSLDTVEMLMTLEEEFGIQIPDEEAMQLSTIKSIVDLIDSKK